MADLFDDLEDNPEADYKKLNDDLFHYIHHFYEEPIKSKIFLITYMIKNILTYDTYLLIKENINMDEYIRGIDEYTSVKRLSNISSFFKKIPDDVIRAELQPFIRKPEILDKKISDKLNERKNAIQSIAGDRFFYKYYLFLLKLKTDFDNEHIPRKRVSFNRSMLESEREFNLLNMYIFIFSTIYKKIEDESLPMSPDAYRSDYARIFEADDIKISAGKKYKTKKRNQKNKKTNKRKNKQTKK
jgi:hypothetical protein